MDQAQLSPEDLLQRIATIVPRLKNYDLTIRGAFVNWFRQLVCRDLPEAQKLKCAEELDKIDLREVDGMHSNLSKSVRKMYDEGMLAGKLEGKVEGKIEGKIEGKREGILQTTQRMLACGIDIELIAKCTGLSTEEIRQLKQEGKQ
ncbi:MAG TPA: hypothetical protein VEC37_08135 [Bacillota bacterium]|nr:hypothetical protein [Bacillota bacterium]